jgi:hypothetical protein
MSWGSLPKPATLAHPVNPEQRPDAENPAVYKHRCLTPAVFGHQSGFIGFGFHPYGVVAIQKLAFSCPKMQSANAAKTPKRAGESCRIPQKIR